MALKLTSEGTHFTFTQESTRPLLYKGHRPPDTFRRYVVGFVELGERVLIGSLIIGAPGSKLCVGNPMVSTTIFETETGESLHPYAIRPM